PQRSYNSQAPSAISPLSLHDALPILPLVTPGISLTMTQTGEELDLAVAAAAQGDRTALARVLELVRPLVVRYCRARIGAAERGQDRKSTRLNSSHVKISYAVFCLKKK